MWFVDVDASFGVNGRARWRGTEEGVIGAEHAEPGFGAGSGNGQIVTGLSGW